MWGNIVIVLTKMRDRVMETLEDGHMGTVKMKGLARWYVWWRRMDEDIEGVTKRCEGCQGRKQPKQAPLLVPMATTAYRFCRTISRGNYIGRSGRTHKRPDNFEIRYTTAAETVATLRSLFARMCLPEHVVSNNGPQFVSG